MDGEQWFGPRPCMGALRVGGQTDVASVPCASDGARETHAVLKGGPSAKSWVSGIVQFAFLVVGWLFSWCCIHYFDRYNPTEENSDPLRSVFLNCWKGIAGRMMVRDWEYIFWSSCCPGLGWGLRWGRAQAGAVCFVCGWWKVTEHLFSQACCAPAVSRVSP